MDKQISRKYFVLTIIFLAVIIRFIGINKSFQGDEFFSIIDARVLQDIPKKIVDDTHPPLYFYLLHFLMKISMNEAFLRLLSIVPGIGLCWLTYAIGRETFTNAAGFISALTVVFAPVAVWSSQYIRTYSMASFFLSLSVYFLILIMKKKDKDFMLWVGFTLASIASIYTFYFSALLLIAENVFVIFFMRRNKIFIKKWTGSQVLVLFFYLPWIPFFIQQRSSYVAHPQMLQHVGFYIGSMHIGAIIRSTLGMVGLDPGFMTKITLSKDMFLKIISAIFIFVLLSTILFLAFRYFKYLKSKKEDNKYLYLFFILSLGPFVIALIFNQAFKIILMSHYFITSFVFLVLFLVGIFNNSRLKLLKSTAIVVILTIFALRLWFLYQDKGVDFKSARKYITGVVTKDATIISPTFGAFGAVVGYYLSDISKIYYVENYKFIQVVDKNIIFVTCPNKLELRHYNEGFRAFLDKGNYRYVDSKIFGDLLVECYKRL